MFFSLCSLVNKCINIENNLATINESNELIKKSKNDMKTIIKFYPEEKIDIDLFLKRIREFGEIYKDNDLNIISNEKNYLDIDVKSTNKIEPNCFSFEIKGFTSKDYTK
jgi:hypothetical protein